MKASILILLIFCATLSFANDKNDVDFKPIADSINTLFSGISKAGSNYEKEKINSDLILLMHDFLKNKNSFDYPIDTLKFLSCLKSSDNALIIYTWNLNYNDGSFKYFGFVQQKCKDKINVYKLEDKRNHSEVPDQKLNYYTTSEWYGCIYYEIVTKVWNSKTYYTLMGWDGANFLLNRKIIEVLSFTKRGIPLFEKKMFKANKVISNKMIFEYADRATMMVRYNDKHGIIVMDHLSPAEERFKGLYQYYGPDFSFDAMSFKGGRWLLESNIDPNIAINYQKNPAVNRIKKRGVNRGF